MTKNIQWPSSPKHSQTLNNTIQTGKKNYTPLCGQPNTFAPTSSLFNSPSALIINRRSNYSITTRSTLPQLLPIVSFAGSMLSSHTTSNYITIPVVRMSSPTHSPVSRSPHLSLLMTTPQLTFAKHTSFPHPSLPLQNSSLIHTPFTPHSNNYTSLFAMASTIHDIRYIIP